MAYETALTVTPILSGILGGSITANAGVDAVLYLVQQIQHLVRSIAT